MRRVGGDGDEGRGFGLLQWSSAKKWSHCLQATDLHEAMACLAEYRVRHSAVFLVEFMNMALNPKFASEGVHFVQIVPLDPGFVERKTIFLSFYKDKL